MKTRMTKLLILNRHRFAKFLYYALCTFLLIIISSCSDTQYSSPETGSIAFDIEWKNAPTIQSALRTAKQATIDCDAVSVATVRFDIYDENNSFLVGDSWPCYYHQGTVDGAPVGSNRKLVVLGEDDGGIIQYRGEVTGITVTAGQTTNVGSIEAETFKPVLVTPEDIQTVGSVSFIWQPVTDASEYRIQVSTESIFTSTVIDETVTTTSYSPTITLSADTYYWKVRSADWFANKGAWSEVWSFTVSPSAPTATITSPSDGSTYTEGDTISFTGTGEDAEDGTLSGASLIWTCSIDGEIGTGASFERSDLSVGTHIITLTATDSDGATGSDSVSITVIAVSAPSAPTNVTATPGDGEVTISWDSVPGATSYNIYWAKSTGVSKTNYEGKIEDIKDITKTSYTHTGLTNGTTYYYVVIAENSYGESGDSAEISATPSATGTAPSAPTNVTAAPGDGQVWISWDSVTGATSYNIYWSTSPGITKETGTKISTFSSPYIHIGLTNDTTYYYVVTAENSYGESGESDEVNATPLSTWTMLKLPDTGQTQSYTDIFGEDSDYTINPPSYTDNGDGTVTDNVTGLMWQQEDDDTARTWDDAGSYCSDLTLAGYSDWRLPSKKELMSIVDYGTSNPSIDSTYFSGTNAWGYWSSTTYAENTSSAWDVNFSRGFVDNNNKSSDGYVRCVRGVQ